MEISYHICRKLKPITMSDFIFRKNEQETSKANVFSIDKAAKKEIILIVKLLTFIAAFAGLIFMSVSSNNLFLTEILVGGGILSLIFFIHIMSNRQ